MGHIKGKGALALALGFIASPARAVDTVAPVVMMATPALGSTVGGRTVKVSATATDDVKVVGLQFHLDGKPIGAEERSLPYAIAWDSFAVPNGAHVLTAVARDAAGNRSTSKPFPITVRNAASRAAYEDLTCKGLALESWKRDSQGWTVFPDPIAVGGRAIHVSATNAGIPSDPATGKYFVTTVAEGNALLRKGFPDQLLFNRGETFVLTRPLSSTQFSGASIDKPMVIGAYGTGARPVLVGQGDTGIVNASGGTLQHLAFVSLDLRSRDRAAGHNPAGLRFRPTFGKNILIEDVSIDGFFVNVSPIPIGSIENLVIRRSQLLNAYAMTGGHAQGIFASKLKGLVIEESLFDHNGFKTRDPSQPQLATIYNHNIYLSQDNACLTVRNNLLLRASSHAAQVRAGGVVEGNVISHSPLGIVWGGSQGGTVTSKHVLATGATGRLVNNAVIDSIDLTQKVVGFEKKYLPRDGGIELGSTQRVLFSGNILARHERGPAAAAGVQLRSQMGIGIHNVLIENNVMSEVRQGLAFSGEAFGPLVLKNDGINDTFVDDTIRRDMYTDDGQHKIVEVDEAAEPLAGDLKTEMNGADLYDPSGRRIITSREVGIVFPVGTPERRIDDAGNRITDNIFHSVYQVAKVGRIPREIFTFERGSYQCVNPSPDRCAEVEGQRMGLDGWLALTNESGSVPPRLIDPSRSLLTYFKTVKPKDPSTVDAFVARARVQRKGSWDPRFAAPAVLKYLREGFTPAP